ncbi:MAG: 4Fe-4S binding protein [Methanosarcinales archaeon]|nr:4Fe-4S binding protein [Methanosarcinales archaeon]
MIPVVDRNECTGCGICVDDCPAAAITMDDADIAVIDKDACTDCGICISSCPAEAITEG